MKKPRKKVPADKGFGKIESEIKSFEKVISSMGVPARKVRAGVRSKSGSRGKPRRAPAQKKGHRELKIRKLKRERKQYKFRSPHRVPPRILKKQSLPSERAEIKPVPLQAVPPVNREPVEKALPKFLSDKSERVASPELKDFVETNIDKLYDIIKQKSSVSVEEASKIFWVPTQRIEQWADILENHDLIRVHYPKFGKPLLTDLAIKEGPARQKVKSPGRRARPPKIIYPIFVGVLLLFVAVLPAFGISGIPNFFLPVQGNGIYLLPALILILLIAAVLAFRKKRGKGK